MFQTTGLRQITHELTGHERLKVRRPIPVGSIKGLGMSFHSHNKYRLKTDFSITAPKLTLGLMALLNAIRDVRGKAGQEGVRAFVNEWRQRGHIVCSDEEAERLINDT